MEASQALLVSQGNFCLILSDCISKGFKASFSNSSPKSRPPLLRYCGEHNSSLCDLPDKEGIHHSRRHLNRLHFSNDGRLPSITFCLKKCLPENMVSHPVQTDGFFRRWVVQAFCLPILRLALFLPSPSPLGYHSSYFVLCSSLEERLRNHLGNTTYDFRRQMPRERLTIWVTERLNKQLNSGLNTNLGFTQIEVPLHGSYLLPAVLAPYLKRTSSPSILQG